MIRELTVLRAALHHARRAGGVVILLMVLAPSIFGVTQLQMGIHTGPVPSVSVVGPPGTTCAVQWTEDLYSNRWSHLAYCTLANGRVDFPDVTVGTAPWRFYRVLQVPATDAPVRLNIQKGADTLLSVSGPVGAVCQIQWSDDLSVPGRWFHLGHCVLFNSSGAINDSVTNAASRYYRVVQVPDTNTVLIPAGAFVMGSTLGETNNDEAPAHSVYISGCYMDQFEVTRALWDNVFVWATNHGYTFDYVGLGKAPDHPVHSVSWNDAVKWCNARSERVGLSPCYYADTNLTVVYRTGNTSSPPVIWSANGYRLPTEAEWEKAARGGVASHRFPWHDTEVITHSRANFYSQVGFAYDPGPSRSWHAAYRNEPKPYTSPVGAFAANVYGLYDMAGNIAEWCWDSYDSGWYATAGATQMDSPGPMLGATTRVVRGGSWNDRANNARCADRFNESQFNAWTFLGFRCVRRP